MMKLFTAVLLTLTVSANLPTGTYELEKIQCTTGKTLKLGGTFMKYKITLEITDADMKMTAIAKSAKWSPFKLDCTQVNYGKYSLIADTQYEGSLELQSTKCNAKTWENILIKQHFGVEEQGTFNYTVSGNKLTIQNPNTFTKYSCEKKGGYPIYHYTKK